MVSFILRIMKKEAAQALNVELEKISKNYDGDLYCALKSPWNKSKILK